MHSVEADVLFVALAGLSGPGLGRRRLRRRQGDPAGRRAAGGLVLSKLVSLPLLAIYLDLSTSPEPGQPRLGRAGRCGRDGRGRRLLPRPVRRGDDRGRAGHRRHLRGDPGRRRAGCAANGPTAVRLVGVDLCAGRHRAGQPGPGRPGRGRPWSPGGWSAWPWPPGSSFALFFVFLALAGDAPVATPGCGRSQRPARRAGPGRLLLLRRRGPAAGRARRACLVRCWPARST